MKKRNQSKLISKLRKYLKLSYKSLDINIIDDIISNILTGNGNSYSDEEIINVIKGLCYHYLSRYYNDYQVEVITAKEMDSISKLKNCSGLIKGRTIYLERELLLDIRNLNVEILRTVMHETLHIGQISLMERNDISFRNYLLISEQIIVMEMDDKYFRDNYYYLFDEVDARWRSEFELYDYLKKVAPHLLKSVTPEMLETINDCEIQVENIMRQVKQRKYSREELLDRIVKRKPEYISECPILSLYYNDDGSKISLSQLLIRSCEKTKTIADSIIFDKILKLDKLIIKNRDGTFSNLRRDLQSLSEDDVIEVCQNNEELSQLRKDMIAKLSKRLESEMDDSSLLDVYDEIRNKLHFFKEKLISEFNQNKLIPFRLYCLMQELEMPWNDLKKIRKK